MPAYQYKCEYCSKEWTEYHGFEEEASKCPFCEKEKIKKIYNYVTTINKLEEVMEYKRSKKVGTKTREYIEQARQDLKEHKAQSKK